MTLRAILLNFRVLAVPLAVIVGVVILSVIALRIVSTRLTKIQSDISLAEKEEAALEQKLELLQEFSSTGINSQIQTVTNALPSRNSGLLALSQVKNLANIESVSINNVKVSSEINEAEISHVEVSFDANSENLGLVINFLESLSKSLPLMRLEKLQIISNSTGAIASVAISSYWSAYPTAIPALTQAISDLSVDERDFLSQLGAFSVPAFAVDLTPSVPFQRENPFGL